MQRNNKTLYKKTLVKAFDIKIAAKALAYFLFREVIEDVHSEYNISQDEMKAMNRKAVNRAAAFLECLEDEERFASLVLLLSFETTGWDNPKKLRIRKGFYKLPRRVQRLFATSRANRQQKYTDNSYVSGARVKKHSSPTTL